MQPSFADPSSQKQAQVGPASHPVNSRGTQQSWDKNKKRNERTKRSETKRNETKRNETKRNERNERKKRKKETKETNKQKKKRKKRKKQTNKVRNERTKQTKNKRNFHDEPNTNTTPTTLCIHNVCAWMYGCRKRAQLGLGIYTDQFVALRPLRRIASIHPSIKHFSIWHLAFVAFGNCCIWHLVFVAFGIWHLLHLAFGIWYLLHLTPTLIAISCLALGSSMLSDCCRTNKQTNKQVKQVKQTNLHAAAESHHVHLARHRVGAGSSHLHEGQELAVFLHRQFHFFRDGSHTLDTLAECDVHLLYAIAIPVSASASIASVLEMVVHL